jgi:hypothetical protein
MEHDPRLDRELLKGCFPAWLVDNVLCPYPDDDPDTLSGFQRFRRRWLPSRWEVALGMALALLSDAIVPDQLVLPLMRSVVLGVVLGYVVVRLWLDLSD